MNRRGWLSLVLPAMCVGLIPACFSPSSPMRSSRPFTGDAASRLPQVVAARQAPQELTPGARWSPYNQQPLANSMSPPRRVDSLPLLPKRPPAIGFADAAGQPMRPTDTSRVVANKPVPQLLPSKYEAHASNTLIEPIIPAASPAPGQPALPKEAPKVLPKELTDEHAIMSMMRCYLEQRPGDAAKDLGKVDPQTREVLLTLVPLTARVGQGKLESADPKEVAVLVDQLQGLLWSLRPRAALVMDKFCFCRQIRRFGVFEAMDGTPTVQPGEMVEIYAEIRNVSSQPLRTARGDYRTYLRSSLDIRKPSGESVWSQPKRFDKPDETMTPQHDYFQHFRFQMPALEPGKYVLVLEVIDVPTGRKVKQQLNFTATPSERTARAE